jgi:peptidoglycan/xylan/chitin deacetylase (PgdA/CDA1 family)
MRFSGFDRLILDSAWRQRRLPIFCFHGVSTADEHECYPGFFLTREVFRRKLSLVRELGLTPLSIEEGVQRLMAGTLPKRSVVITLDDGFYGAFAEGAAILEELGFPVTVYMTTHYVNYNRPVFDNMCGYLLWKAFGKELYWDKVFDQPILLNAGSWDAAQRRVADYATAVGLNSAQKDDLLAELAGKLGIDYSDLSRRRLFCLVNPDEIRSWKGVDFQLHTHRHRISRQKPVFADLIRRNADELRRITGKESRHFAYPGGLYFPEDPDWLRELGVKSAVTCVAGMATASSDCCLLPRVMDTAYLTPLELASWMTGTAALLPARSYSLDMTQELSFAPSEAPAAGYQSSDTVH